MDSLCAKSSKSGGVHTSRMHREFVDLVLPSCLKYQPSVLNEHCGMFGVVIWCMHAVPFCDVFVLGVYAY